MKASKKALPGDYVATMEARTPEVNATAQFRIAVKHYAWAGRNISYRCSRGRCLLSIPKIWKEVIMGEQVIVLTDLTKKKNTVISLL